MSKKKELYSSPALRTLVVRFKGCLLVSNGIPDANVKIDGDWNDDGWDDLGD